MFFDRSGIQPASCLSNESARIHRRWAVLGLAAAMAVPTGLLTGATLRAADRPTTDPGSTEPAALSTADLLALAQRQIEFHQYDAAVDTLHRVKTLTLPDAERARVVAALSDATKAADQHRMGSDEYKMAQQAMAAKRPIEAREHLKTVIGNRFADPDTIQEAKTQLAKLDSGDATAAEGIASLGAPSTQPGEASPSTMPAAANEAQAELTPRQHYELGQKLYRQNDWAGARTQFEAAAASKFHPDLFQGEMPSVYLTRMDEREHADKARAQAETARYQQVHTVTMADGTAEVAPATNGADPAAQSQPTASGDSQAEADLAATAAAEKLRRQEAAYQANKLVQQAQAAQQDNNLDKARQLYSEASDLDPSNKQASAGLNQVLIAQGRAPRVTTALTEHEQEIQARVQEIRYRFQTAIQDANDAIAAQKFDVAQAAITRAQVASASDRGIFPSQALREFDETIRSTQLALQQAQQTAEERARVNGEQQQLKTLREQQEAAARERQRTIAELRTQAMNLTEQRRYQQALGVVDQILTLDPTNEYAVGVKPLLEDRFQFMQQRDYTETRNRKVASQLVDAEEKLIPYDDILRYPSDWPDISSRRDQTVAAEQGVNKEDRAVQAQLDRALPELQFDGVGFSDVVDFLRDVSGANIFVNWKSLDGAGIDRNAPVTARLRNVKFSKALNIILDSLGGGTTKLGYTVDDGVITISTSDDLSKNTMVRVYDIRDLIISVPDFSDAPDFSLNSTSNNGSQNPSGGSGGSGGAQGGQSNNLFSNTTSGGTGSGTEPGQSRQELVDAITKLITDTVAPDSWRDAGGSVGAIRELSGQLIVTQTPENQHALSNLLEQLRETRAIQVTVETRFLTVQRNFLEDVGVDLNFIFNGNGNLSKKFGSVDSNGTFTNAIPVSAATSSFTEKPSNPVPGSISSKLSAPGLSTSVTFLDDFQVNLLLSATEASQNSIIVTAPRVTLFNGQRAYVLVATQQAYVSNLTPSVGTGVSAFAPQVSVVESGVELDVAATVSADRKYVTLTLRPQLSTLLSLAQFSFQQAATGVGTGIDTGTGTIPTVGSSSPSGVIQVPEIQITEVKTTVSVPDGGTLLLGGQTIAGEITKEEGVPVLSKIPFLKRLFTNRTSAKDEQVLLILVRPTILIQREIEQRQFPLLTSKLGSGG